MSEPRLDTGDDLDMRILDRCISQLQAEYVGEDPDEPLPSQTYQWMVLTMLRRIVNRLEVSTKTNPAGSEDEP